MGWLTILGLVVIVIAVATMFKLKPDEGRPAARTRLMTVARVVAILIGLVLVVVALVGPP